MATEPSAPAARESDSLMTQVNPENVLRIRNALRQQMDTMLPALQDAVNALELRPCGNDPISRDATPIFQRKIFEIVKIHWAHYAEIDEAVERLTETARVYGYTDGQIEDSLARYQAAL